MRILKEYLLIAFFIAITMANEAANKDALRAVSQGSNKFASLLFKAVADENPGNLIMSPLSVSTVLAMAAYGAAGETKNQFQTVLHLPSPDNVGTLGYQALIDNINRVKENELLLANKVFAAEKFAVKSTYKELTQTYFRSTTQLVNFAQSTEAANTINSWVKQNTRNRIDNLVTPDDLNDRTALVLVNAVYFKGQWKKKFIPEETKNLPFSVNGVTVKQVPTMRRVGSYEYAELPELNAKMIEIPYKGNELSMVIILPNEVNGLPKLEEKLKDMDMTNILSQGSERKVDLFLPKFKIEQKIELNSVLEKVGLGNMFTVNANFSGIADEKLSVSKVVQKAFIEVNEEGSEAAAATGVTFFLTAAVSTAPPLKLRIDRPFFYNCIYKTPNENNEIITLFSGHVNEP